MQTKEAQTHVLKIWPEYFDDVESGKKNFEVRKLDRLFGTGDILELKEWSPLNGFTGRITKKVVTYLMAGGQWGIPEGTCIMGLADFEAMELYASVRGGMGKRRAVIVDDMFASLDGIEIDEDNSFEIDFGGQYRMYLADTGEGWRVVNAMNGYGNNCRDQFEKSKVTFLYDESGDSSTSQPAQGEDNAAYWKHRCKLAECVIEATPCDPDITSRQIKANDEYRKFLAGAPIPQDVIRADGAAELLAPQPIETLPAQGVEEAAEAHKLIDQFIEERVEYIQEWAGREYELLRKVADFVISQFAGASYQSSNGDKELQELRAWKREAISVMPDYQAIGKAIGVQPGETVHDKILPFIERLSKGTVDRGANCPACNITKHGVKTRIAPVHTCGRK